MLPDVASGDGGDSVTSPATSTSVLLVTELIRLTLKKLQTALEDSRINNDDLVAMAMAVDAGAVSAALNATLPSNAATCLKTSQSLPGNWQTSNVAGSTIGGSGFSAAAFESSVLSSTDRPVTLVTGDWDQTDTVLSSEIAAVAKKVLSDVMDNLTEQ